MSQDAQGQSRERRASKEVRRFSFVALAGGSTNKWRDLPLCLCSKTGGAADLFGSAGLRGIKGEKGTLFPSLSCAGPSGRLFAPVHLFCKKLLSKMIQVFSTMKVLGSTLFSTMAPAPAEIANRPGMYKVLGIRPLEAARHRTRADIVERIFDNESAADCTTVSEQGLCYREERGRRQMQGRSVSFERGPAATRVARAGTKATAITMDTARAARRANLLTRQD